MALFWRRKNREHLVALDLNAAPLPGGARRAAPSSDVLLNAHTPAAAVSVAAVSQGVCALPLVSTSHTGAASSSSTAAAIADNISSRSAARPQAPFSNQRLHSRTAVSLSVVWEGVSGRYSSFISNISVAGCYVDTIGEATVGETVSCRVRLASGQWAKVSGEVIHYKPHMGFGLRFTDTSESDLTRLLAEADV